MNHRAAVGLGWFLVSFGLIFLLYQLLPWQLLTAEDRAMILISLSLILLGCYFALGWVKSSLGKELIRGVRGKYFCLDLSFSHDIALFNLLLHTSCLVNANGSRGSL